MISYVFLLIFAAVTTVHLYASAKLDKSLRDKTKPWILLSLLGFYVLQTDNFTWLMVLALIFSWLGDVLLMKQGVKWFTFGGIAFMISHGFFIGSYMKEIDFSVISIAAIIVLAAVFIIVVSIIFSKLKQYLPKKLFYPMFLYLLINGAMNCFAIFRLLSDPWTGSIVTCIGAILFFVSDSSLFFVRFNKDGKQKSHFLVMLTYSIGELLIVLGMI